MAADGNMGTTPDDSGDDEIRLDELFHGEPIEIDGMIVDLAPVGSGESSAFSDGFDESKHPRAADGKFGKGSGGKSGGGKAESTDDPQSKAESLASRITEVPRAIVDKAASIVKRQYSKLEAKYGPTGAKLVIGGMIALSPVPIPGTSLLPIALAEAVKRGRMLLAGGRAEFAGRELSGEALDRAIAEALAEFYAGMGEHPPAPLATSSFAERPSRESSPPDDLLSDVITNGIDAMVSATESALRRLLPNRKIIAVDRLFSSSERDEFQAAMEGLVAAADLLGRATVRHAADIELANDSVATFADSALITPDSLRGYMAIQDAAIAVLPPRAALDYFRSLVPTLNVADPSVWAADVRRRAFSMVVATEETLLSKVQQVVHDKVLKGENVGGATADIQELMDAAGVSHRNPQYAEMVWRTNAIDALNTGKEDEFRSDPEIMDAFPVWQYTGVDDSRAGDDHRPHFGKYYPNAAQFGDVRGARKFNCRCGWRPLSSREWKRLQARGAVVETSWGD